MNRIALALVVAVVLFSGLAWARHATTAARQAEAAAAARVGGTPNALCIPTQACPCSKQPGCRG